MPSISLTIDRTGMSLANLVFSGANGTALGLISLQEPVMLARTEYAASARFIHGSFPVASTWDHSAIVATVELKYSTASALRTGYLELVAALNRITFPVTITKNAVAVSWTGERGSLALASDSLTRHDLERTTELYRLTIPVHPIPA